jgi:hypothetical protein
LNKAPLNWRHLKTHDFTRRSNFPPGHNYRNEPFFTESQAKLSSSPNKNLKAVVISVGKKGYENRESRVEIQNSSGKTFRRKSFASHDEAHGRGIGHAERTVDGQFFVFNTESSGGHQPWHYETYFYSRRKNRFYRLDDYVGPVTSDFILEEPTTVKATRFNFKASNEKEPVAVRLEKLSGRIQ